MSTPRKDERSTATKRLSLAFLLLSALMVATQLLNFVITLLPSAQDAVVDVGDGTTISVASLRTSYLTLTILVFVVFALSWFFLNRRFSWARWVCVVLAVLGALTGVQGLWQAIAAGIPDLMGPALRLAQVIAAGWFLALVFRPEVHQDFIRRTG